MYHKSVNISQIWASCPKINLQNMEGIIKESISREKTARKKVFWRSGKIKHNIAEGGDVDDVLVVEKEPSGAVWKPARSYVSIQGSSEYHGINR